MPQQNLAARALIHARRMFYRPESLAAQQHRSHLAAGARELPRRFGVQGKGLGEVVLAQVHEVVRHRVDDHPG